MKGQKVRTFTAVEVQENPKRFDNKAQIDAKIRARTTILRVRGLETVEV